MAINPQHDLSPREANTTARDVAEAHKDVAVAAAVAIQALVEGHIPPFSIVAGMPGRDPLGA